MPRSDAPDGGRALALTEATLREPLRRVLGARPIQRIPPGDARPASVLVPLFERDGEAHVWLVRRPRTMRRHAGQVAFPGGKADAADGSPLVTALREAHEELGIPGDAVDVLGPLDEMNTRTGFAISPFVGWLAAGVPIVPNAGEVDRAFAAPVRAFLEPPAGVPPFHGWTIDGELVWGATAHIVRGLVDIVRTLDAGP